MKISRGDIWLSKFFEFPHENTVNEKQRPVLIIQNDEDNGYFHYPFVIVLPITTKKTDRIFKQDVLIAKAISDLSEDSKILCGIIRTVLKKDLVKKIGKIDKKTLEQVNIKLFRQLGFLER
jgi:mRNA-degrading endonuclease toxin of MazEF toxin-antitoxin module